LRRAELLAEDIADEIVLNESNGWTNLVSTLERVEAVRHNLNLATENLEISTYAYGEGLGTILDVLQAQLSWLQIYNNAIAAQYDYALAIAAYQYIIGESLDR
jgi:outer membrane protein TolC